jgi:hypothetical protein
MGLGVGFSLQMLANAYKAIETSRLERLRLDLERPQLEHARTWQFGLLKLKI